MKLIATAFLILFLLAGCTVDTGLCVVPELPEESLYKYSLELYNNGECYYAMEICMI